MDEKMRFIEMSKSYRHNLGIVTRTSKQVWRVLTTNTTKSENNRGQLLLS